MAPGDAEDAATVKGAAPYVWLAIAAKLRAGVAGLTLKLVVTVAALYEPEATWLACSVTTPAPVRVTVLPAILAGPLTTE
jgi:uncharacterized membrane protein